MPAYSIRPKAPKKRSVVVRLFALVIVCLLLAAAAGTVWFVQNTKAVDSSSEQVETIVIDPGASEAFISQLLEEKGLIRSSLAYQLYGRIQRTQGNTQAGSYELSPSMSVADIVNKLTQGDVAVQLITILPAQRISQLREYFIGEGYFEAEVDAALDPATYAGHPALAGSPSITSLEGYLSPESFQYTDTTPLKNIIESSLDITASFLTDGTKQALAGRGLSVHDAIILASIVEQEVNKLEDKPIVAQVFLSRLEQNIALGSDPTAFYGAALLGLEESVLTDTLYNTRLYPGLPPGPIGNISASSLDAVANPSATDYLFFVAGDDGTTHYSRTVQEHEALTAQFCTVLCQSPLRGGN